jgi:osmotically-inducible protein OsmY
VRDGTAYLTGTVRTAEEKQEAEKLALSVEGIDKVRNEIVLDESIPQNQARFDLSRAVSDANITAMVKSQLLLNDLTHALKINVSTNNGIVTLAGPVSSEEEAQEVLHIATRTRMVDGVDNQLELSPRAATADSGQ